MARAELIGHMDCPECSFPDAEVRPDKSGAPYRFCPDCTAQYFTRGGVKATQLLAKVRKITTAPAAPVAAVPVPVVPVLPAKPVKKPFSLDAL